MKQKGSRKIGRNKFVCLAYKNSNRREKNKLRRLEKHIGKFPNDRCAEYAADRCKKMIRGF